MLGQCPAFGYLFLVTVALVLRMTLCLYISIRSMFELSALKFTLLNSFSFFFFHISPLLMQLNLIFKSDCLPFLGPNAQFAKAEGTIQPFY